MNYYNPNFYTNYMPQYQPPQLNGKIVDSAEAARVTDVPIGGYGVFPKADLSEIYLKSWNNNGTTNLITFKPVVSVPEPQQESEMTQLLEKLTILETKLDAALKPDNASVKQTKEIRANDY